MDLTVLGCHGGETRRHRTSSFLLNGEVALDAGAITSQLSLREQQKINTVLVSHAHLDHIRDLATLADNRCQVGGPTIDIVGTPETLDELKRSFFNDRIWPNFAKIETDCGPTIRYLPVVSEDSVQIGDLVVKPVPVSHTIDSSAFLISYDGGTLAYSGDTGPTDRLWEVLNATEDLSALIIEVSLPNHQSKLARASGHHTTNTLEADLEKLVGHEELPIKLFHIKPVFQAAVEKELARLRGRHLQILELGDEFIL